MAPSAIMHPAYACSPKSGILQGRVTQTHANRARFSYCSGCPNKQLKRVRAIFIGHGEVGKTSLIRALHGEDVIAGEEAMTLGVATTDSQFKIHKEAGVFTRTQERKDDDLIVHFWDFGGQVMAHATHQFFLRLNVCM